MRLNAAIRSSHAVRCFEGLINKIDLLEEEAGSLSWLKRASMSSGDEHTDCIIFISRIFISREIVDSFFSTKRFFIKIFDVLKALFLLLIH